MPLTLTLNIPNALTIARILLVPVFIVFVFYEKFAPAFFIFALAGLTDALDGFIAKRFDRATEFGMILDPVADKFLLMTSFLVIAMKGWIPLVLCVVVLMRDMTIVFGFIFLKSVGKRIVIGPSVPSKITTVLQITTILSAIAFASASGGGSGGGIFFTVVLYLTAFFTLVSWSDYSVKWVRALKKADG